MDKLGYVMDGRRKGSHEDINRQAEKALAKRVRYELHDSEIEADDEMRGRRKGKDKYDFEIEEGKGKGNYCLEEKVNNSMETDTTERAQEVMPESSNDARQQHDIR